jgi:hypothetical protein
MKWRKLAQSIDSFQDLVVDKYGFREPGAPMDNPVADSFYSGAKPLGVKYSQEGVYRGPVVGDLLLYGHICSTHRRKDQGGWTADPVNRAAAYTLDCLTISETLEDGEFQR